MSSPRCRFVTFWTCQKVDIGSDVESAKQAPQVTSCCLAGLTLQHFATHREVREFPPQ